MRIIGIDPGTVRTGYGLVLAEEKEQNLLYICSGAIKTSSREDFSQRLKKIYDGILSIIKEHSPDAVAIEELFFAHDVKAALKLGHASGVALLASANLGLPVFKYSSTHIKKAVLGYGRGEKHQIQKMVQAILGLQDIPETEDAADALAVAICHIHNASLVERIEKSYDRYA